MVHPVLEFSAESMGIHVHISDFKNLIESGLWNILLHVKAPPAENFN